MKIVRLLNVRSARRDVHVVVVVVVTTEASSEVVRAAEVIVIVVVSEGREGSGGVCYYYCYYRKAGLTAGSEEVSATRATLRVVSKGSRSNRIVSI